MKGRIVVGMLTGEIQIRAAVMYTSFLGSDINNNTLSIINMEGCFCTYTYMYIKLPPLPLNIQQICSALTGAFRLYDEGK